MSTVDSITGVQRLFKEEPSRRPGRRQVRMRIGGLHCSLCTGTIERTLGRIPGVEKVAVSLTHEQALVEYIPGVARPEDIVRGLREIGYTVWDPSRLRSFDEEERALVRERRRFLVALGMSTMSMGLVGYPLSSAWSVLCVSSIASMVLFSFFVLLAYGWRRAVAGASLFAVLGSATYTLQLSGAFGATVPWLTAALAISLVFGVSLPILRTGVMSLRRGILNQHVLVGFGAFAGLVGGVIGLVVHPANYPTVAFFAAAVMVLTYHIFSEWLSLIVKTRSSQAVKKLLDLEPEIARVVQNGKERDVLLEAVQVGDLVRIRPGERVPVDGRVEAGESDIDESLVTGEPIPVDKRPGERVLSGSLNGRGTLLVRVEAVGEQSFLRQVIRSVEEARALKPGLLHLVDRVLRVYTPTVLLTAAAAVLFWLFVGPWLFEFSPDLQRAMFAGLSVLIMGYPCAVGISAPLSIVRGAGDAAARGVLMRTGEAFEALRRVTYVVFDKTGTLTEGRPSLRELIALTCPEEELLTLAAAVEVGSEHPLARAVVEEALQRKLELPEVHEFRAVAGQGVEARLDGKLLLVGSPAFLISRGVYLPAYEERILELESRGFTVIGVAREGRLLGLLAVGDALRPDAVDTVDRLRRLGIRTSLVTGDNERAAHYFARAAGIEEVHARILPAEKAALIRKLQETGARVAMVGDGINDAPALMQADVGIAFGSTANISTESADVIILNQRLGAVLDAYEISRRSYRKMVQNVWLAFSFNGIGIPLATTGLLYPIWAMVAMVISVTSIFINSLWGRGGYFFGALRGVGHPEGKRPDVVAGEPLTEVEWVVPNMVCESCAEKISEVLGSIEGVRQVKPKVSRQRVLVSYVPDRVRAEQLKEALDRAGYNAAEA